MLDPQVLIVGRGGGAREREREREASGGNKLYTGL
jgi:hypothetical protein